MFLHITYNIIIGAIEEVKLYLPKQNSNYYSIRSIVIV